MTLGRFLREQWLPAIRSTIRPMTFSSYEAHVRNHIEPRLGKARLTSIDGLRLNALYAELASSGRLFGGGGLSPATVRRVHTTLHRAFRDAVRWGYLETNPCDRADPPKVRADAGPEMRTWTAEQLRAFLEYVADDELYPLWLLLAMTGMRRGEAVGVRWGDVDLGAGVLAVRQTIVVVDRQIMVSRPKTARGRRVIALDEGTVSVLRERGPGATDELIFSRSDGAPLDPRKVTTRFRQLVRWSGLPRIRLHDLRHTHATLALQADIHPKIVSERLGHSTIAFTLDVYSHAIPHMQAEAAAKLAELVGLDSSFD